MPIVCKTFSEAKIIPSKCPILNGANGIPPKTKSPKPKSAKMTNDSNFGASNEKSEEQWIDGPKVAKYRQINGSHASGTNNAVNSTQSPAKKKGETWIDGPAARVHHQASNFPSPKKTLSNTQHQRAGAAIAARNGTNSSNGQIHGTQGRSGCDLSNCPSVCISATKAEMIQKWISNQTPSTSDLFDESPTHKIAMESYFAGQENSLQNGIGYQGVVGRFQMQQNGGNNTGLPVGFNYAQMQMNCCSQNGGPVQFGNIYSCHCLNRGDEGNKGPMQLCTEPEYKALTVFKTCDDTAEDDPHSLCNGYDFEFIEVVEPEIPVPTKDVCLQVS